MAKRKTLSNTTFHWYNKNICWDVRSSFENHRVYHAFLRHGTFFFKTRENRRQSVKIGMKASSAVALLMSLANTGLPVQEKPIEKLVAGQWYLSLAEDFHIWLVSLNRPDQHMLTCEVNGDIKWCNGVFNVGVSSEDAASILKKLFKVVDKPLRGRWF